MSEPRFNSWGKIDEPESNTKEIAGGIEVKEEQIQDILAEYEEATSNRKGGFKIIRTTYAKRIATLYSEP